MQQSRLELVINSLGERWCVGTDGGKFAKGIKKVAEGRDNCQVMSTTIGHFMWGYQDHFRIHMRVTAEFALKRLDLDLQPEVFLVGILQDDRNDRFPACVEPEEEHWIESEAFYATEELAEPIRETYVESRLQQSHPLAQQRQDEALKHRSIRDAILQIIENHARKPQDRTFFASIPVSVEGYLVSTVLSVRSDVLNARHRLSSDRISLHELRTIAVSRSLIDAAIDEILSQSADGLLMPDAGLKTIDRDASETIRAAGRHLAIHAAFRVNRRDGFHGFYEACDAIAALKYEQAEGRGRLLLAPKDQAHLNTLISFKEPVKLQDYRRVRKLLELTSDSSFLHTDSKEVFGLVETDAGDGQDMFEVVFRGHHQWELRHGGELLMAVRFGEPHLPRLVGYEAKLRKDLPRLLPGISLDEQDRLVSLVRQTERASHGTLTIISAEAASEAERLKSQSTLIEPRLLDPALLDQLLGIDGAVLIDAKGCCHAIGVILDGQATDYGDAGRGSRYNSALRYVKYATERQIPTIAIVISEDGGVDVIPDPPPAIKRSSITDAVEELEAISKSKEIPRRRYNELYDWLRLHRFYLLGDDCRRINIAVQDIEKRFDEEGRAIWISRENFNPDPRMNPSFFYEAEDAGYGLLEERSR